MARRIQVLFKGKLMKEPAISYTILETDTTFNILKSIVTTEHGEIIGEIEDENNYIENYDTDKYKFIEPDKSLLYTFKAKIIEAVDGDTVKALLFRGFGIKTLRTLRLRGINAKDLQTEQGRKARDYIVSKLFMLPFVIIKTYSRDIYLRYLADVFYLKGNEDVYTVAAKGKYLNKELINEGLAEKYVRW